MNRALAAGASALEIAAAVQAGTVTASEVVEAAMARIAAGNPAINAFTGLAGERAAARAAFLDRARASGTPLGPLAGVPFGVKAMIDIAGLTTTAGSALFRDAPPAARDAAVVQRLEAAGAVCIGALNMDEFGMGGTTENAHYGATRNPHDRSRTAGGSSGGSAAALAAGLVPLTLGSDALGSIRLPASLCGVYGLRPTRGTIPGEGILGGGTLATAGPLARSAADLRTCHAALRGVPIAAVPAPLDPVRIALAGGAFRERLTDAAREALRVIVDALHVQREIEWPEVDRARAAAMLVNCGESATAKLPLLRERLQEFDPATRDRFLAHALLPAQWYLAAQRFRLWHAQAVERLFETVDVIVLPATPCVAPLLGQKTIEVEGASLPTGPTLGWFTQAVAGTDCPALSVPVARQSPLPIGVQLVAAPHREDLLFRVAAQLEASGATCSTVAAPH